MADAVNPLADGSTPNLGLIKPEVGASDDVWGDKLNANFDIIDTDSGAKTTSISGKVSKAGDTMAGHLALPTSPANANAVRKDYVDAADALKTDKTYVDAADALKADKTYVDAQDALKADKTYVDTQDALRVAKAGDTMTGHLTLPITPAAANAVRKDYVDAANALKTDKTYVDTQDALKVAKVGDTMTGHLVLPTGPGATNAVRKDYVDAGDLLKVAKAGDTMTGSLTIAGGGTLTVAPTGGSWPTVLLNKSASGQTNQLLGYTNNNARWLVQLGDSSAETGGNAGSDFAITRASDAGVLATPVSIERSTGRVIVGQGPSSTDAMSLHVNSAASFGGGGIGFRGIDGWYACIFSNAAGAQVGGILTTATTTSYNTTSDDRLKEDLQSFDAGNIVDDTEVYDFKWKTTGERSYGVIAQQAIEVYPAAVTHTEKNDWWGVDYSRYVPVLLQELKALRARVAALEGGTAAKADGAEMTASSVKETIDALRGTPFLLAIVILNVLVIASMALTLHYVSDGIERRDALIKSCLERTI